MTKRSRLSLLRLMEEALAFFVSLSIQGAVCITFGFLALALGMAISASWYQIVFMILIGMALPLWPLHVYYAPERTLERLHRRWDRWVEAGILSLSRSQIYKRQFREWYESTIRRRYPGAFSDRHRAMPLFDDPEHEAGE